jgi:hypothetical protein
LASATVAVNLSRIAASTDSRRIRPVMAAKLANSGTLGTARPTCLRASSLAGQVNIR